MLLVAVICVSCEAALSAPLYTLTDLGMGPSNATGINNAGQVIGNTWANAAPNPYAFWYSGGHSQGLNLPYDNGGQACDINDAGVIVGGYIAGDFQHAVRAYLYSNGQTQDLGTLPGGTTSSANGINSSGQVVGYSDTTGGANHAFLYSGAQMQDLGTLPGGMASGAYGINNGGQVVGYSYTASGPQHAFLYSGGQMQDLGTLPGGSTSLAYGIDIGGQIVGSSDTTGSADHAFLYSGGQMQDLGTLPDGTESHAFGINSSGQVVGWSKTTGGADHAFLYSGGNMIDLNSVIASLGWTLYRAEGINDTGQIVGYGASPTQSMEAFLLTPIPEPATLSLLGLGGLTLLRRRSRR